MVTPDFVSVACTVSCCFGGSFCFTGDTAAEDDDEEGDVAGFNFLVLRRLALTLVAVPFVGV